MKVVLITGSRLHSNRALIERAMLGAELAILGDAKGADELALDVALDWDIVPAVYGASPKRCALIEAYIAHRKCVASVQLVADWRRLGKKAGHVRNAAMVHRACAERDAGMDVCCHAFPLAASAGTHNCIAQLHKRGFYVDVH